MKFEPFGDRVLVRPIEEKTTNKSGVLMPDSAKEKPQEGEVLELGTNVAGSWPSLGDRVLFGKYAGAEIVVDGEKLLIMNAAELLGRLTGEEAVEADGLRPIRKKASRGR